MRSIMRSLTLLFLVLGLVLLAAPVPAPGVPVVAFQGNVTSGPVPLTVAFTDTSANAAGRAWYFGDETCRNPWILVNGSPGWIARARHISVALPDGSIVLAAGYGNLGWRNDTWRSADKGGTWVQVNASSGWRGKVAPAGAVLPGGRIVLTGGENSMGDTNDTWLSGDSGVTWRLQSASAGWVARDSHATVGLPDGSIVLTGGYRMAHGVWLNDTWRSTDRGISWKLMNGSSGWVARYAPAVVSLPDGSIVLAGGFNYLEGGYLNDTWRSTDKGRTWIRLTGAAAWPGRDGHGIVVLPDGSIVLAGGYSYPAGGYLNDTWRSTDKGRTWTRLTGAAAWPARWGHGIAVLPDGRIVLTGGLVYNSVPTQEVWRLNTAGSLQKDPVHTYTAPGTYTVTLQAYNPAGYNNTRKVGYITVIGPVPAVSAISPAAGIRGRTAVISNLSGTNFTAGASVYLNRTGYPSIHATNVRVLSPGKITCAFPVPATAPLGPRNLVVKNINGKPGMKADAFMVRAPVAPTVSALVPAAGKRGTLVTIMTLSGTGFIGTPKPKVQLMRGPAAITATNVTVVSAKKITCTFQIPSGAAAGAWDASVTNGDNQKGVKTAAFMVTS